MSSSLISFSEVIKHNSINDCWTILYDYIYNITDFLNEHPGGSKILLEIAGKDGTVLFESIHNSEILKILKPTSLVGKIDKSTIVNTDQTAQKDENIVSKPPITAMVNTLDIEMVASKVMKPEGWNYYCAGGDDEITLRENRMVYNRIWFRPRIGLNVDNVDTSTMCFGKKIAFPAYVSATALAKLADPVHGELSYIRGCRNQNVPYMISTFSSTSQDVVYKESSPDQVLFLQLYVWRDRKVTYERITKAEAAGVKAMMITVDAPNGGRRERDIRMKTVTTFIAGVNQAKDVSKGVSGTLFSNIDATLDWKECVAIKKRTTMKVFLKGIQTFEDAVLAYNYGFDGIVLSNHGGRQLDTCPSGMEVLFEVMPALRAAGADLSKFDVYVDGGVRRGADIFKALALGAKAVGIGRATLYGLAAYGQEGVELVLNMIKSEFENCMKLSGCTDISQITPNMVCTRNIHNRYIPPYEDNFAKTYLGASRL